MATEILRFPQDDKKACELWVALAIETLRFAQGDKQVCERWQPTQAAMAANQAARAPARGCPYYTRMRL